MGEVVRIEYELVWLRDRGLQYLYLTQCKVYENGSQSAKSICIFEGYVGTDSDIKELIVNDYLMYAEDVFSIIVMNSIAKAEKDDDVSGYPDLTQYEDFDVIRRVDAYIIPDKGCFYEEVTI